MSPKEVPWRLGGAKATRAAAPQLLSAAKPFWLPRTGAICTSRHLAQMWVLEPRDQGWTLAPSHIIRCYPSNTYKAPPSYSSQLTELLLGEVHTAPSSSPSSHTLTSSLPP